MGGSVSRSTDGVYTFYTNSDDGSGLYIGGEQVVRNDGRRGMVERAGLIGLRAGVHAIRAATVRERFADVHVGAHLPNVVWSESRY